MNEAWNKLANSQCPKYSGTVCSLIPSPKELSKGHKLNKVKINQLYNQNTIIKAFVYYKEAVVQEALEQVLLCSKGKSTARCRTEKLNPAGEAVFGAKRNQHLCRNASKLLENGKGVWCWDAECVDVALGPVRSSLWTRVRHSSHAQPLQATFYWGFALVVSTAVAFSSFTTWNMGVALPLSGMPRSTVAGNTFLYAFCFLSFGETESSRWLCDVHGCISIMLFIQVNTN